MSEVYISVEGRQKAVPVVRVESMDIVTTGRYLRIANIKDEEYAAIERPNLDQLVASFRQVGGQADIFAFSQDPLDGERRYDYPVYWDNAAIVTIESYDRWLASLGQVTRRNIRLAAKRGVTVSATSFDDALVRGIHSIYNETPFRQGRRFWHYGKNVDTVRRENGTFPDRSQFIAAHADGELIGFIKLVHVGRIASIMQILSKASQQERRPTNALLAKAVEICAAKGVRYLKYCKYVYHQDPNNPLTDFKRRHGFEQVVFPRYFVPLSFRGRAAVALRLQLGPTAWLPPSVVSVLLKARAKYNSIAERHSSFSAGVAQRQSG